MMENTQQVQNPASQSLPIQPAKQKPYSKKNWIKWILVAFFLILLIAIPAFTYYLYLQNPFYRNLKGYIRDEEDLRNRLTPTPSILPTSISEFSSESTNSASTANWKTHTDSQYYVLKIPPEFEIRNEELDKWTFEEERSFNSPAGSFSIRVSRVKSGKQIEEMATDLMSPITVDEIQISNINAKRWHGFGGVAGVDDTTVLIFEYKNATYLIKSWFPRGGKFDQFSQILQTFKFTDSKPLRG